MTNEERRAIADRLRALGYLEVGAEATPAEVTAAVARMLDAQPTTRRLADEGREYRTQLVREALDQGQRAHGSAFDQRAYRGILEAATLAEIKRFRSDWRALGDKAGRPAAVSTNGRGPLPAAAYG
jgi:hypothetical protein